MLKINRTTITNLLIGIAAATIIVYFYPHPEANQYKFEEGRPWNYAKLIAPFDIPIFPDPATVQSVRDSLDRTFVPVFERSPEVVKDIIAKLMEGWDHLDKDSDPTPADEAMRRRTVSYIKQAYSVDVIDDEYGSLIDRGELPAIRILENSLKTVTTRGISSMADVLAEMPRAINPADTLGAKAWILKNDIAGALAPNLPYDSERSSTLYQNDLDRLAPIKGVIQQGQTIIDKGTLISSQDFTNLLTYERMINEQFVSDHRSRLTIWLGQALYVFIILAAMMSFLKFSASDLWDNRNAMVFVLALVTLMFLVGIFIDQEVTLGVFIVPFGLVPVLMIIFFNASVALFTTLGVTMLVAGAISLPLEFIVLQMVGATAAVFSLNDLTKRSQLLRTSLFVFVAYVASYFAIELMINGSTEGIQLRMIMFLAVSALLSSTAFILMAAVEKLFGFVSTVTLMELADTNNPILRELSQECPGTFQHSMAVGNLATDAAIKINADEKLVRVGALYHDIGKLSNPNFFTENQRSVNPHDALPPERSAEIIIGHVRDGIVRADKAGLPSVVKDFILQHHGKGKAKYFYYTYCSAHPGETPNPAPFTYPGPNPQTREASLLMMADSVEAASRSLQTHTPEAITQLVNKIIDGQIADGLHNESPLNFRDVNIIKEAFIRRLMTMYHSRIVYPNDPNEKQS